MNSITSLLYTLIICFQILMIINLNNHSMVMAKPDRSPICDVNNAVEAIRASPMGTTKNDISKDYTFSTDKQSYGPGEIIMFTITGNKPVNGLLVYVSPSSDEYKRVGQFVIPDGMQNNAQVCQNSEFPESSLTHTQGNKYDSPIILKYTAPNSADPNVENALGDLNFNVILVQKLDEGGFNWGVFKNAVTVKGNTNNGNNKNDVFNQNDVAYGENTVEAPIATPTENTAVSTCDVDVMTITSTETMIMTSTESVTCTETVTETQWVAVAVPTDLPKKRKCKKKKEVWIPENKPQVEDQATDAPVYAYESAVASLEAESAGRGADSTHTSSIPNYDTEVANGDNSKSNKGEIPIITVPAPTKMITASSYVAVTEAPKVKATNDENKNNYQDKGAYEEKQKDVSAMAGPY